MSAPHIPADRYLTPSEAASFLGITRRAIEYRRHRGGGPPVTRLGRICRYKLSALLAWAESNTEHPEPRDEPAAK